MNVVPGHIVGEGPHLLEKLGAVPALHILHHHAQMLIALEAAVHRDDEGIVSEGKDVSLSKRLLNLVECSYQTQLKSFTTNISSFLFLCAQSEMILHIPSW